MRTETESFEITIGSKKFETTFTAKVYESLEDVLKEAKDGGEQKLLQKINEAEAQKAKNAARAEYIKDGEAAVADSFEKQVKMYMKRREKIGKPVTEAQARVKVQEMNDED